MQEECFNILPCAKAPKLSIWEGWLSPFTISNTLNYPTKLRIPPLFFWKKMVKSGSGKSRGFATPVLQHLYLFIAKKPPPPTPAGISWGATLTRQCFPLLYIPLISVSTFVPSENTGQVHTTLPRMTTNVPGTRTLPLFLIQWIRPRYFKTAFSALVFVYTRQQDGPFSVCEDVDSLKKWLKKKFPEHWQEKYSHYSDR